jgi:hypothetical protein
LVYVTERANNPKIEDFVDALYFTVADALHDRASETSRFSGARAASCSRLP